jgi:uncharacterized membrane protein
MATRGGRRTRSWGWSNYLVVGAATVLVTFTLTALSFGTTSDTEGKTAISLPLIIHLGTVLPALPLGAYVLIRHKGSWLHRLLGRIWAGLMTTTAVSAFWLQDTGGLSFIHLFSAATLISIPLAIFWIRRGDVERHRRVMTNIYIGLVVAGLFAFAPGRLLGVWLLG